MERVIIPDSRDLSGYLVEPMHEVNLIKNKDEFVRLQMSDDGEIVEKFDKEKERETKIWSCICGEKGESEKQAHQHLNQSKSNINVREAKSKLEGIAIHGFEFSHLEAHGASIAWEHQELGMKLYATPLEHLTDESGKLGFQIDGTAPATEPLTGHTQFKESIGNSLTWLEYIQLVREYIEKQVMNEKQRKQTRGVDQ